MTHNPVSNVQQIVSITGWVAGAVVRVESSGGGGADGCEEAPRLTRELVDVNCLLLRVPTTTGVPLHPQWPELLPGRATSLLV